MGSSYVVINISIKFSFVIFLFISIRKLDLHNMFLFSVKKIPSFFDKDIMRVSIKKVHHLHVNFAFL